MSRPSIALALTLLGALGVSACAPKTLPARPDSPAGASDAQRITLVSYHCESGASVSASYPTAEAAVVQYRGTTHSMRGAPSASGARYLGETLEWWTKGRGPGAEATLFAHTDEGGTGEIVESCRQSGT